MKKLSVAVIAALIAVSLFVGQSAARAEEEEAGMGGKMPAWMQKTEQHEALAKSAGDFTIATEMTMMPGAPAQKGTATGKREMIMNGMYLKETFKMTFGGKPFEGHLITGYDTVRKKHVSLWYDNMSPVPSISYGTEKDGKLVFMGEGPDMAGQLEGKKMVIENLQADTWTVTFIDIKGEGQEHVSMRLAYTRKK